MTAVERAEAVVADVPGANQFMIGVIAMVSQHERELISTRASVPARVDR